MGNEELLFAIRQRGHSWREDDICACLAEWAALIAWAEDEFETWADHVELQYGEAASWEPFE